MATASGCDSEKKAQEVPAANGSCNYAHGVQEGSFWTRTETLVSGLAGVLFLAGLVLHFGFARAGDPLVLVTGLLDLRLSEVLFLLTLVVGSAYTVRNGLRAVLTFSMSIDFLITVALLGALVLGKFVEAAALGFLYGVAELLEDYSMRRAEQSLGELLDLSPDTATVRRNGTEEEVPLEEIEVGETVVARPGQKIAMDGEVVDGQSSVDEAPLTGESMPVGKSPGDDVFAGTFNQEGYLEIEVTARAEDNTLARIIRMVREADATKAPSQRFVDTFTGYYTPAVVGLALIVGLIVPFVPGVPGGFSTWWLRAMALLVIACPCGLLISTPVTVVSGITSAAGHGALIKGGEPFEFLGNLSVICFDKTGTLTEGEPVVSEVVPLNGHSEEEVLQYAAAVESRSEHPLARALVREAGNRKIELPEVRDFESTTATGVSASVNGTRYRVGKPGLFEGEPPEDFTRLEDEGMTVVCVGDRDSYRGVIGFSDRIRSEARGALSDLKDLGLEVAMITGDNERTARAVAEELGIDRYYAGLLPEEKVNHVERLREEYGTVGMVGDGINDAPALAAADVGVAMGAAGNDTALETADVALMGDNLNHVSYVVKLSRTGENIIRQNIYSSIGVKILLAVGVIPGWVNLITAVLVGDMGVTFGITGNALRLRQIRHEGEG